MTHFFIHSTDPGADEICIPIVSLTAQTFKNL
jgi:hypothetical protein